MDYQFTKPYYYRRHPLSDLIKIKTDEIVDKNEFSVFEVRQLKRNGFLKIRQNVIRKNRKTNNRI